MLLLFVRRWLERDVTYSDRLGRVMKDHGGAAPGNRIGVASAPHPLGGRPDGARHLVGQG